MLEVLGIPSNTIAVTQEGIVRVSAFMPFVVWATGAWCDFAVSHTLFSRALVEVRGSSLLVRRELST